MSTRPSNPKLPKVPDPDESNETIRQLEELDDIIFPAIAGDETALEEAAPAWNQALSDLGPDTVRETRKEYLRFAQSTWNYLSSQTIYQPERVLAVLKVMLLLTSDDRS